MKKQTIVQKIKSMTAQEIIMAMVDGLRNPVTEIDMGTYGEVRGITQKICFGCAATNTICQIGGYTTEDLLRVGGRASDVKGSKKTVQAFEEAINQLRLGAWDAYNDIARHYKFACIKNPENLKLPWLRNDFTNRELKVYERLAKSQ